MPRRLAVMADYVEEGWTSMDYCAEMLHGHLPAQPGVRSALIRPTLRSRAQRLPGSWGRAALFNADRIINRFWDYPRVARRIRDDFDLFHVCDHTYSQLVHRLPRGRVGVYCHDLDAFRCLIDGGAEPRPRWFRALARRVLDGLSKAAVVFCSTGEFRRRIVEAGIVDANRVVLAPYGVAEEYHPGLVAGDSTPAPPTGREPGFLLHVGSTIPRKRIDVLLESFAGVRSRFPGIRLVQVGGSWTAEQEGRIDRLGIAGAITQLRGIDRSTLADLYRRSAAVLLPSEAEGFGLPLIEALACGSVVVASDIPVIREVGGSALLYEPVGDPAAWSTAIIDLLDGRADVPSTEVRLAQAARYTWAAHAETIAVSYLQLG